MHLRCCPGEGDVSQPQVAVLSQSLCKSSALIFAVTRVLDKKTLSDTSSAFGCCLHSRNSQPCGTAERQGGMVRAGQPVPPPVEEAQASPLLLSYNKDFMH